MRPAYTEECRKSPDCNCDQADYPSHSIPLCADAESAFHVWIRITQADQAYAVQHRHEGVHEAECLTEESVCVADYARSRQEIGAHADDAQAAELEPERIARYRCFRIEHCELSRKQFGLRH